LLNTSLNLGGNPIANTTKVALEVLKNTKMDAICIGNKVYEK
jgi:predicted NodU family carbamoyl transferase